MALTGSERVALETIRAASLALTGEGPIVREEGGRTVVRFKPGQAAILRGLLAGWLDAPAGGLKVEWINIAAPLVLRRAMPWILAGGGVLAGLYIFSKRGRRGKHN